LNLLFDKLSPIKILFFIARHAKCSNCGSKQIGKGEGGFVLTEGRFYRYCKCGLDVKIFASTIPSKETQYRRKAPYI